MEECESMSPENLRSSDKFLLPSHPKSMNDMETCDAASVSSVDEANSKTKEDNNANLKSTEVHLPNGVTRLSPDSNGLIPVGNAAVQQKITSGQCPSGVESPVSCCCDNQSEPAKSSHEENEMESIKSSNQTVLDTDLSTEIGSLSLEQNEMVGDRDIMLGIEYVVYKSEVQMPDIMRLITKDLSEPYSIYTYRYFIHNWPKLCFLAMDEDKCVGAIVCKLDMHKKMVRRGYIAMLAVDSEYRRKKIGSHLVLKAIKAMIADDCDEVVLETEITNQAALQLYENLGFVRDKRLFRYYLNGVDALRLKLWLR